MSTLFVVSTPIGNLEDLTHRAERVLETVGHVLAEDTRRTGRLMKHLGVKVRLTSLHAYNETAREEQVLAWLAAGEDVALVSDAGTPLVSDPGARIVGSVLAAGHEVVPVPGASAVLAALVASGLPAERFAFLGFVPRKGPERRALLARVADSGETAILFESPERLRALLDDLAQVCGPERRVAVGRELTKLHETVVRGTMVEVGRYYRDDPPRGEVTVVVEPAPPSPEPGEAALASARELARELLGEGSTPSRAAKELSRRLGLSRNLAYEVLQEVKDG